MKTTIHAKLVAVDLLDAYASNTIGRLTIAMYDDNCKLQQIVLRVTEKVAKEFAPKLGEAIELELRGGDA